MKDDDRATYLTYMNCTDVNLYSINMVLPYRFLEGNLYGQFIGYIGWREYKNFKNGFEPPTGRADHFFNGNVRANLMYNITDRLSCDAIARWDPPTKRIQTTTKRSFAFDFGCWYSLLREKNLIVGFSANNLFNSSDRKRDIYFLDNYRYGYTKVKGPIFAVSVKLRINRGQNVVDEYRYRTPEMKRLGR